MELPHDAAAVAASLLLKYSSLELACCARRYASPNTGPRTARETAWLKAVPRAMAEGLTEGRSKKMKRQQSKTLCIRRGIKTHIMHNTTLGPTTESLGVQTKGIRTAERHGGLGDVFGDESVVLRVTNESSC